MAQKRTGLGRGLGALIPSGPVPGEARPSDMFFRENRADDDSKAKAESPDAAARPLRPGVDESETGGGRIDQHTVDAVTRRPDRAAAPAAERTDSPSGPVTDEMRMLARADEERAARQAASADLKPVPGARFAELPLTAIRPNPKQPRTVFDQDELAELVHSVREIGILQPVVVRPIPEEERKRIEADAGDDEIVPAYELVMGERRWRASQAAATETIPAIIRDTSEDDLLRDALLENLHRSQLNALEEAAAYLQLLDDFGCTQDELANRIGRSRPQISNTLRLLRLPPVVQRRVAAGILSAGHARALLGLADGAAMERLAQRIVAEGLSVRSVEEIVAMGGDTDKAPRRGRSAASRPELDNLSAQLSDQLETRVTVTLGQRKGKLSVEFADLDDLHRILDALGVEARMADG